MDITKDPLYKEVVAWKNKNESLYYHIMGLYERISFLREKKTKAKDSEEVYAIDNQIMSAYKEIEQSVRTMEYGIPMTEVTKNG